MFLSVMVATLEQSFFTHRNQMQEVLSKPTRRMTATHISLNTKTGENVPLQTLTSMTHHKTAQSAKLIHLAAMWC